MSILGPFQVHFRSIFDAHMVYELFLRPLMRRNNESANDIKKSLKELETIMKHATALGVKSSIVISPMLVVQPEYFSGMIVQMFVRRKRNCEILASGGRFDGLIAGFAAKLNMSDKKGIFLKERS